MSSFMVFSSVISYESLFNPNLEQEAMSYPEKRGRVLLDDSCQAFR